MNAKHAQLAIDSRELAKQIMAIRRRHSATKWPKHQWSKRELLQFLEETALLLDDAADALDGKN